MDLRSQVFLYSVISSEIEKIIYMFFKSNFMTKNVIPFLSLSFLKIKFDNKVIYISICLITINNYLQI